MIQLSDMRDEELKETFTTHLSEGVRAALAMDVDAATRSKELANAAYNELINRGYEIDMSAFNI